MKDDCFILSLVGGMLNRTSIESDVCLKSHERSIDGASSS